jgi:hypothetical protein
LANSLQLSPESKEKLKLAGGTLASALAAGLLGGAGSGALASQIQKEETPEQRKARILKSILTGGGMAAGAGALLPLGTAALTHREKASPAEAVIGAPVALAKAHAPLLLGAAGTGYMGAKVNDKITEAIKARHPGVKDIPSHLTHPDYPNKPDAVLEELVQHLKTKPEFAGLPDETVRAYGQAYQNRRPGAGNLKRLLVTENMRSKMPEAVRPMHGSRQALKNIRAALDTMARTKVPFAKTKVKGLPLAAASLLPLLVGGATEYSMSRK